MRQTIRSTTILCVRRGGKVVMGGDGQVTFGQEVLKASAHKLRRLYNSKILAGFAGSTADAFALFARFESKLEQHNGNLPRAVVELAKEWRTDRVLRHLEALLLVADTQNTYIVSGNGDVIEPDNEIAAIGSGGPFAKAAATALVENTKLTAREIAEKSMLITGKVLGAAARGTGAHGQEWRDGKRWFAVPPSREVYCIDLKTWIGQSKFSTTGNRPHGIGWEGKYLWVTDSNHNAFFKHDPETGAVLEKFN